MSEYGEFCRDMREHKKEVRSKAYAENIRFCKEMVDLGGVERGLSGGYRYHFIGFRIDFWPSSGKWTVVGSNVYEIGPRKMVNHAKALLATAPKQTPQSTEQADPRSFWPEESLNRDSEALPWED